MVDFVVYKDINEVKLENADRGTYASINKEQLAKIIAYVAMWITGIGDARITKRTFKLMPNEYQPFNREGEEISINEKEISKVIEWCEWSPMYKDWFRGNLENRNIEIPDHTLVVLLFDGNIVLTEKEL